MQCPLCRESVADDNALQVHYLMSCLGYLENASTSQHKQAPPSKKVVQFRWIKTKPTLAREVYLISSVAGSVKLEWRPIDECFLSEQVEVSQGLHVCQLIVDGDSLSTDDFNVSDTSRTIDVLISEASQAEESTGNTSGGENHELPTQQKPHLDHTDEQDGRSEVTTRQLPPEGSLYRELLKHQILHGDSLETLTGDASSGRRDRTRGQRGDRTRGNGVATRISRDQRSGQDSAHRESTGVHITRPGHTARSDISDLPNERQRDDVLRDSMSSDELQQFLQPTRTRQESNGDAGNADVGTTEDRESSLSENEDHSVSLSSHEGLEKRPELLGQSNGETESRVQPDTRVSDQDPDVDANHEESVSDHRQETLLVDLREPSSGRDREGSSMGRRDESGSERRSDDNREGSSKARHRVPLDRGETTGDLPEKSSGDDRRRLSDDSRERPSSSRRKQSSRNRRGQSSGDGREPTGDINERPEDHRESSGSHREPSANKREALGGDNREHSEDNRDRSGDSREPSENNREQSSSLRTEASSGLRQETSSGLQERTSTDNHDPESVDRRERTSVGHLEGTSGDERRTSRSREGISESEDNRINPSSVNTSSYISLPTKLYPDLTQITRTDAFTNTRTTTVQSGLFSGDLISPRRSGTSLTDSHGLDSQTRGLISPGSSAASLPGRRGLDSENNVTGTDDLLFRSYSTGHSGVRTNTAFTRDNPSRDFTAPTSDSAPSRETKTQSKDIGGHNGEISAQRRDESGPSHEIGAQSTDVGAPNREISAQSRDTNGSNREVSSQSRDTSGPNREIGAQSRDTSGSNREVSSQRRDTSGSNREISAHSRDTSGPRREVSSQSRDTSGPNREISAQSTDTSGSNREISAQRRDVSGSNREISAQSRDTSGPNREISAQSRDTSGSNREISAQSRDTSGPNREISAQSRDTSGPNREISAQSRDTSGSNREISAQSIDTSGPNREISAQRRDTSGSNREVTSQNRDISASREVNRYQQSGLGGDILALTRRSPQGSFMDDSSIRRPPLYTSAPSRPSSSPPYSYHRAISPLSSPRDGEVAVSSSSRYGPSSVSRATTVTTQSMLDRGSPTGSALSPEGTQAVASGAAAASKQFSEDGVKELLETLKKNQSSRRKVSPETSPRERLGASEISALRQKLVERDEAVKKLKAKNASYKERIEQLREKEMELTKALSLAETSQKALREQEEISSELENALGEKEKQFAEMEVKVLEMKREKRRMDGEFEQGKKDYEKKIQDLRKVHVLLEQEVGMLLSHFTSHVLPL
ncbi:DNA-directed RNA polymerase II subunit RPB1-like [Paramuricea clavata]|uniref:DNA-directed RNA polymerase II subunit RPB1-like n=1 Tax=Paramuricea clavata TaxID=317549 RepID=A0A6S7FXF5_PARCT|nr:DNA-directed RNA polymerase II subunit RPB1-like [Paramuricea clavata]